MATTIRTRTPADAAACEGMAREVQRLDGYPVRLPDDLRGFIVSPVAIEAWVADDAGAVVGHVGLHATGSHEVMTLAASELAVSQEALALVARLLVAPSHRRRGIAASLLATASAAARQRGFVPVLDVASHFHGAIKLYEDLGWIRLGKVSVDIGDPPLVEEFVYAAPPATGRR